MFDYLCTYVHSFCGNTTYSFSPWLFAKKSNTMKFKQLNFKFFRIQVMIHQVNDTNDTDDSVELTRHQSKVNIHSVVLVIMVALVVTFLMVVGVSYLYEANNLKGQSSKYFCPSASAVQMGICVKS